MVFGRGEKEEFRSYIKGSEHTDLKNKKDLPEIEKIADRLDEDEKVLVVAKQSRVKPGGSLITTPNIIFATDKRLIIRNPTMLGMRENVEDYAYDKITYIKLEKGVLSSTLVITAPGMGTAARAGRSTGLIAWGRGEDGMIDAIPKDKAEEILLIVRERMNKIQNQTQSPSTSDVVSIADELMKLAKLKEQGILSEEEFNKMKTDLINKSSS